MSIAKLHPGKTALATAPSPSNLRIIGTPGPSVERLASALSAAISPDHFAEAPDFTAATAGGLTDTELDSAAYTIVLVADPTDAVAHSIANGCDPAPALEDWSAAARALLHRLQRCAGRSIFVDAAEALNAPNALAAALGNWHKGLQGLTLAEGMAEGMTEGMTEGGSDELDLLLARAAVTSEGRAGRLFAEVHARCLVLHGKEPVTNSGVNWRMAIRQRAEDRRRLAETLAESERQRQARQDEIDQLHIALGASVRAAAETRSLADEARSEGELLAAQLRDKSEALVARDRELQALQDEARQLRATFDRSGRDTAAARAHFEAAQQENQLLSLQLEQAQEELDLAYERQARRSSVVDVDALRILDIVEKPPHRHLHADLRRVRAGSRSWHSLEIRLVEHGGRPGVVFFGTGQTPEPIYAWTANGREQTRDFMLLVPQDDAGRERLLTLGTSDWRLVCGSVEAIATHLELAIDESPTFWLCVARRLQADLRALAPRFRYDGCSAQLQTNGTCLLAFDEASYRDRLLGQVQLCWQPALGSLAIVAPQSDSSLPLSNWPVNESGVVEDFVLPHADTTSADARRDWWAALATMDQEVILALIEAMPEALRRTESTSALIDSAKSVHADVLAWQHRGGWRAVARRLLRRSR